VGEKERARERNFKSKPRRKKRGQRPPPLHVLLRLLSLVTRVRRETRVLFRKIVQGTLGASSPCVYKTNG